MIENHAEKEIESITITKNDLIDYVCELHCKCGVEFAFMVTKDLETKRLHDQFKFVCEYCNKNVKKDMENKIIAACSNLDMYGDHRDGLFVFKQCLSRWMEKDQLIKWKLKQEK